VTRYTFLVLNFLFIFSLNAFCFSSHILTLDKKIQEEMLQKKTYQPGCPVHPNRLKLVNFSYYDFNGVPHHDGEIVVMDAVAEHVVNIFRELYKRRFPLHKSKRIEYYNGSDALSLEDNNTSSFNCRKITGSSSLPSMHAYGLAIDMNPLQNPSVMKDAGKSGKATVLPKGGLDYLNRKDMRPGMVEPIVEIFKKNGFRVWGGQWNVPIDWQHFQTPRNVSKLMASMTPDDAKTFFILYSKYPALFDKISGKNNDFILLYNKSPEKFMTIFVNNVKALNQLEPNDAIDFFKKKWRQ
jgi:hypothetical protein